MNDDKIVRGIFGMKSCDCHIMIEHDYGEQPTMITKAKDSGNVYILCKDIIQGINAYYYAAENYRNLETFGD